MPGAAPGLSASGPHVVTPGCKHDAGGARLKKGYRVRMTLLAGISVGDWDRLEVPEGYRAEIIAGELVVSPSAPPRHGAAQAVISALLVAAAPPGLATEWTPSGRCLRVGWSPPHRGPYSCRRGGGHRRRHQAHVDAGAGRRDPVPVGLPPSRARWPATDRGETGTITPGTASATSSKSR